MFGRLPDPHHVEDFINSVRSRKKPNADIEVGHRSLLMIHYANISYLLGGQNLVIDPKTEHALNNPEAMHFFKRMYREPWVVKDQV